MILRGAQGLALVAVVALLGLLIWRVAHHDAGAQLVKEITAGRKPAAPDFRLRPIWGETQGASPRLRAAVRRGSVTVADLRGMPTVVNVFASWCVPCKDEAPCFAAAARRYAGRVQFVALDFQDFDGDGRSFLRRYGNVVHRAPRRQRPRLASLGRDRRAGDVRAGCERAYRCSRARGCRAPSSSRSSLGHYERASSRASTATPTHRAFRTRRARREARTGR